MPQGKGTYGSKGCGASEMVQRGLERCTLREALRSTKGRKARNAILQTIEACEFKDTCHLGGDNRKRKKNKDRPEKEDWTTRG